MGPAAVPLGVGLSPPAIAPDGTTYVASDGLYALRPDGTLRWRVPSPFGEDLRSGAVVGADGTVYFATHNVPLTALDPRRWPGALAPRPRGQRPRAGDAGPRRRRHHLRPHRRRRPLRRLARGGAPLVLRHLLGGYQGALRSSPAVAADGTIYLGTSQGSPVPVLLAIRADGTLRWVFEPRDLPSGVPASHFDVYSSPAIGSDGTVYFGQEFGRVYALDGATGATRWMVETSSGITWSSPALTADGVLLVSDLASRLYAISTDSRGLQAGAPWPRYRGGNRSAGLREP